MELNGLPLHVLLVHAVVVLVPTAAATVVASAWSERARRRLGLLPIALCTVALVLTPLTVEAGEDLRRRLPKAPLIAEHAEHGGRMLPWVSGLLLAAVVVHLVGRRAPERAGRSADRAPGTSDAMAGSTAVRLLVAVLATAVAVGATVQTARTGESGARAVWEGTV